MSRNECVDYLPSVDVQATEGLIENTTVYVRSKGLCKRCALTRLSTTNACWLIYNRIFHLRVNSSKAGSMMAVVCRVPQ